jgi:hypothetical protein
MTEELVVPEGTQQRPRVFRMVRLYARPDRADRLVGTAEEITRRTRARFADVPYRCYLARRTAEDGCCEVVAVSVWDTPEAMRQVLDAQTASKPFDLQAYGDALERWSVETYEVFFPEPRAD